MLREVRQDLRTGNTLPRLPSICACVAAAAGRRRWRFAVGDSAANHPVECLARGRFGLGALVRETERGVLSLALRGGRRVARDSDPQLLKTQVHGAVH